MSTFIIQKRIPGVPKEFWTFAIWHDDPEEPSSYTKAGAVHRLRRLRYLVEDNSSVEYRLVMRTDEIMLKQTERQTT